MVGLRFEASLGKKVSKTLFQKKKKKERQIKQARCGGARL
jgi:hypothetical protein